MLRDLTGEAVVVTGGTSGIGLAVGKAFASVGARVWLTHRWSSADEDEVRAAFSAIGAPEPRIVEADVAEADDTERLLDLIAAEHDAVEVFVSNVCVVQPARGPGTYRRRSLLKSLEYSALPLIDQPHAMLRRFGRWPRYIVGIGSDGTDCYFTRYEHVAASKAAMETLCRHMALQLGPLGTTVNILRTRNVRTPAIDEIFGPDFVPFVEEHVGADAFVDADEVADGVLALCSGLLDAVSGQVVTVDRGIGFSDSLMNLYETHQRRTP